MKRRSLLQVRTLSAAILALLCVCTMSFPAVAQSTRTLPSGLAEDALEESFDKLVAENESTTAAFSVAVFNDSDIFFSKAYGFADKENQIRNDDNAVFEWGSCTKLLTWTCVMQLAEEGKVDLDADIRTYLPKDFLRKLRFEDPITLTNLMNHNAGWQELTTDIFIENPSAALSLEDTLRATEPDQVFAPGSVVAYSNWGTALSGYIVECVSGISYTEYVHQNIFDPLGMNHTAIAIDLSDNAWVLESRLREKSYLPDGTDNGTCMYALPLAPAGMATGTMEDFIRFAQAFLTKEDQISPLFERQETLAEMLSPTLFFADGQTPRNAHGFWTDSLQVPVLWHNGGTMGFSSWFTFDPVSRTAMIALVNQGEETTLQYHSLDLVFGKGDFVPGVPSGDPCGFYINARSVFTGFAKFTHIFSYIDLAKTGEGEYLESKGTMTLSGSDDGYFLVNKDRSKSYLAFLTDDEMGSGTQNLEIAASDYLVYPKAQAIFEYVLLALMGASVILSLLSLPVILIRRLVTRRGLGATGVARLLVHLSVLASGGVIALIFLIFLSGSAMRSDLFGPALACAILSVAPVAYGIYLAATRKARESYSRLQKFGIYFALFTSALMSFNIFYWELFRFF